MIKFFSILFIILTVTGCSKIPEEKNADYLMEISVLKTGKSDCTVIESQNRTILIDTADRDSARKITRFLNDKKIDTIDIVIISHFDKDHIGGFETIADRIKIKNVIQPNYKTKSDTYDKYVKKLGEKNINVINAQKDISFTAEDMDFKIYTADTEYEKENNMSLITAIYHGESKLLFAGDIETERCNEILQNNIKIYDFLKIPHHGIYFEGAEEFYHTVSPKIAVITDNEKTDTEKTDSILNSLGVTAYHTKNGTLKFISDGKKTIKSETKIIQ